MSRAAFLVLAALGLTACATDGDRVRGIGDPLPAAPDATWVLTFEDEFDGDAVDPSRWTVRRREVQQKNTLSSATPEMATVHDGSLFLRFERRPENARLPYTAAYLDTDGLFAQTYGKIEFRLRGDFAPGLWYAVWGRPWTNAVPELDVEILAENVSQAWFVNHWALPPAPADERRQFVTVDGIDVRRPHTYAIVWLPDSVEWQIDGKPYLRVTGQGVPHEPIFWIMNGWVGGWAGVPTDATVLPAGFEIESFRVYRLRDWVVAPLVRVGNPRERYSVGDTIQLEIADFDRGARVDVWEGETRLATLDRPPFRFQPKGLAKTAHSFRFVATDGVRSASTAIDAVVY